MVFLLIVLGGQSVAQPRPDVDRSLRAALSELEQEEWERGLELLEQTKLRAPDDPRVDFYRGYALEKLSRCSEATDAYESAQAGGGARLRSLAGEALVRVDAHCFPVVREEPARLRRGTGRFGWKFFGWSSTILGGLTLLGLPVKMSIEQQARDQANTYFDLRHGCKVERDEITGEDCDEAALRKDEAYAEFQVRTQRARRQNTAILATGLGLAGVGISTLVIVAATRPSAARLGVVPTGDGMHVSLGFDF